MNEKINWPKNYLSPNTLLYERYKISAILGSGGFAITYLAIDTSLDALVAIKEFFPKHMVIRERHTKEINVREEYASEFEYEKQIFKKEAERIFGLFDIPGICCVKDYFEENKTAYIVQEYLSGGTFKEYLEENGGRLPFEKCIKLFKPVMEGLCHLHAMGIIHQDISPDNLMFDDEMSLKLIDFGAAHVKETSNKGIKLKENYAPPEQYQVTNQVGPWTDIYSLCAVIYQALTGNHVPPATSRIRQDKLHFISYYVTIPEKYEEALMKGLSLDIHDRYFYIGNLMGLLDMDTASLSTLIEKNRHMWGDIWLLIITENSVYAQKRKKHLLRIKNIRSIAVAILVVNIVIWGVLAGVSFYKKKNPEAAFEARLEAYRRKNPTHFLEDQGVLKSREPERFKRIEALFEPYVQEDQNEGSNIVYYNIPEKILLQSGLSTSFTGFNAGKMAMNRSLFEELLHLISPDGVDISSESYTGSVKLKNDELNQRLESSAYRTVEYDLLGLTINGLFDPVDECLLGMEIKASFDVGCTVFKELFPYIVPQTYLSDDEISKIRECYEDALKRASQLPEGEYESFSVMLDQHALFEVNFSSYSISAKDVDDQNVVVTISLAPGGFYEERWAEDD